MENKFMKKFIFTLFSIVMFFLVSACAGLNDSTFSGSKTGDDNHYDITFDILNTTFSHELNMEQGERIHVQIEKKSGDIKVMIQKNQENPIYEGNGDVATDFYVSIEEAGTYTVSVTGKKAKGRVIFSRE